MKNLLFFVIAILHSNIVYCQYTEIYEFKVQYDMQLNLNGNVGYKANLYFNRTQSLFEYRETPFDENEITSEEIGKKFEESNHVTYNMRLKDTTLFYIKYDRNDNLMREYFQDRTKNESFQVAESAPVVNWTILQEQKRIDQYDCTKATCSFRGRNYIAWFTTKVQTSFGPLKLHGLPGLIIELEDENKEVMLSARVVRNEEKLIMKDPIDLKIISRSEYKKLQADARKRIEEIVNQVISKSGRGFKTTANVKIGKTIELE